MEQNDHRTEHGWDSPAHLTPAIVLIAIGALFLASNLHFIPSLNWFDFWPVILIVIGFMKVIEAGQSGGRLTGGLILFGIGCLFLASNLGFLPFPVWDLWPLILIVIGLVLLIDRVTWRDRLAGPWSGPSMGTATSSNALNLAAVFSGGKRIVNTDDFRGGVISAVFGGFEVDLRQAGMKADSALIKADTVFGGVEIKIPTTWCAEVQGAGVFGGYSDESSHPPLTPGTKRLIVKGGAVFGGVVVKN